jgi:hypothetical protein
MNPADRQDACQSRVHNSEKRDIAKRPEDRPTSVFLISPNPDEQYVQKWEAEDSEDELTV